jgi:four helix bundle protein
MTHAALCRVAIPLIYKDLDAWKQAMDLVEQCYRLSKRFPRDERFGLTSQLRRAAVSIPSNVAEGHCRRKTRVYAHHISIALGSHGELETLIELAARLGFLPTTDRHGLQERCDSVGRLLSGLFRSLEDKVGRDTSRR